MPKKMGTNSKAVEARARKEEKKKVDRERIEKAAEDAYWKDDDKHVVKKEQRKADQERKRQEALERKALNQQLYNEEMNSIKSSASNQSKVTRAQIATNLANVAKPKPKEKESILEENLNRIHVEGEARSVDEAVRVLSLKEEDVDKHPEKRLKAAYTAFEEKRLPKLKVEYPNLRLSQIKQMVKKEWMRSPDNPLNQPRTAYNAKT